MIIIERQNQFVVGVKGIIVHDGKILIIKRADHASVGSGTWECPGGKIEFGENLEAALIREIIEEAGLTVSINKILYATTFQTDPMRQVVLVTYLCDTSRKEVNLSDEHSEYLWASADQLPQYLPQIILDDFEKTRFSIY